MGSTCAGHFGQEDVASLHQRLSLALMRGVGNQLASMGQARELDPIDKWGNERAPRQRKRAKSDLERLVRDILDEGSAEATNVAQASSSASSVARPGLLWYGRMDSPPPRGGRSFPLIKPREGSLGRRGELGPSHNNPWSNPLREGLRL